MAAAGEICLWHLLNKCIIEINVLQVKYSWISSYSQRIRVPACGENRGPWAETFAASSSPSWHAYPFIMPSSGLPDQARPSPHLLTTVSAAIPYSWAFHFSLFAHFGLSAHKHTQVSIFFKTTNQPTNQLGTESSDSLYLVVAFSRNNWQSLSPFLYRLLCPIATCLLPPIPLKLYLLRSPVTYSFGFYLHWPFDSLWHKSFLKLLPPWLLQHQLILFSSCFPDCSFPGSLWTPFPIWMYFIHMRQCLPHRGPVKKKLCMLSA